MIIAGTGHRPNKLGGYGRAAFDRLVRLAAGVLTELQPDHVISGMALGWDQALARAATNLSIPWTAAIPFIGQESQWPAASQQAYRELLMAATDRCVICPGEYAAFKMQKRNEWMVNRLTPAPSRDVLLALWDGSSGGTANCVRYAQQQGVEILNLWDRFSLKSVPSA